VPRAVALTADPSRRDAPVGLDELRAQAEGLASSEEELLLLALFGDEAEPLLRTIRGRSAATSRSPRAASTRRAGADPRARAHRPGDRRRRGHDRGGRDARRRSAHATSPRAARRRRRSRAGRAELPPSRRRERLVRVEAPMVGTFYRAPQPGAPPFVEEGDAVAPARRSASSRR
jgi:biotin carboxyl carrier protein